MHSDRCTISGVDHPEIERELADVQAEFREETRRLRLKRQAAVIRARDAGLSKYKIAAVMGIKGPTVDSIIEAAERDRS
jgi:DNA-directed RNA polymerase specialized sigma24 family protein